MMPDDLERRMRAAPDHEQWVAALADFFAAHDLVFGHGTDNATDEAYWLVRHFAGWGEGARTGPAASGRLSEIVAVAKRRVAERRPLAYLLGEAWFAGLAFQVDDRVLVPRSPFAELIERGFAPWVDLRPGDRVLDVGTGSGCLAIAAAALWPQLRVDATDISRAALDMAAVNVARHGVVDRVQLLEADLWPQSESRYRVIMSNPPYVPDAEVDELPAEYQHEPSVALAGGARGFGPAERLVRGAAARLEADGALFVEVGAGAHAFAAAHPHLRLIWLEFERGGDGVFTVSREELARYAAAH
jgi:ribosomal protein L3 glutamine methyltransferase